MFLGTLFSGICATRTMPGNATSNDIHRFVVWYLNQCEDHDASRTNWYEICISFRLNGVCHFQLRSRLMALSGNPIVGSVVLDCDDSLIKPLMEERHEAYFVILESYGHLYLQCKTTKSVSPQQGEDGDRECSRFLHFTRQVILSYVPGSVHGRTVDHTFLETNQRSRDLLFWPRRPLPNTSYKVNSLLETTRASSERSAWRTHVASRWERLITKYWSGKIKRGHCQEWGIKGEMITSLQYGYTVYLHDLSSQK